MTVQRFPLAATELPLCGAGGPERYGPTGRNLRALRGLEEWQSPGGRNKENGGVPSHRSTPLNHPF